MSGAEVKVTDTGWSIEADLADLAGELQAGVLMGADAHDKVSTADLAWIHEDGAPKAKIPARPFMRPTYDQNEDGYLDRIEDATMRAIKGANGSALLVEVADKMAEDQRKTIMAHKTGGPPLRPISASRVAQRRMGLTPLADSGSLLESLNGQFVPEVGGG